jgi:hypothetical protein
MDVLYRDLRIPMEHRAFATLADTARFLSQRLMHGSRFSEPTVLVSSWRPQLLNAGRERLSVPIEVRPLQTENLADSQSQTHCNGRHGPVRLMQLLEYPLALIERQHLWLL